MQAKYTAMEWAAMQGGQDIADVNTSPQFDFLQELSEARIYRNASTLDGKDAKDLAKIAYLIFLVIEILRHEDPKYAVQYIKDTMYYDEFKHMRSSATDFHNILSVLNNQSAYPIHADAQISVPLLQVKRYFRNIENDKIEAGLDRDLLIKLENYLRISDPQIKHIRRTVAFWQNASRNEKATASKEIKNLLNSLSHQSDVVVYFRNHNMRESVK
jgi:hypothetical protein